MESRLLVVTQSGSVGDLYSLIRADPHILHNVDVLPFIHTPLHEASSAGKMDLAMELMMLKPSFAKKLNEDGFSPLHLAVENQQVDLALALVKFDPSLVRYHGRGGITPFHLVAKKGGVDLLTEFLRACPESIRDANANGQTALHITVMNKRYEELKILTGYMQRMRKSDAAYTENDVLNRRDREGNTALHLAAYENNHEAVKQLLKCISLYRNIQNKSGMTALDVLRASGSHMNKDTEKMLQKSGGKSGYSISKEKKTTPMSVFLRKPVTFLEYCSTGMARYRSRMSDGARNALLVITALIITSTYTTAIQPHEKDKLNNQDHVELLLEIFLLWICNTAAFCSSIAFTYILLPLGKAYAWWFLFITAPLMGSYAISIYVKYRRITAISDLFTYLYLSIVFCFLVYFFIFYVKWKRTTNKKIQKPRNELMSQQFKIMV
ncbi:PREDICTED: ankyrin repeat-containing protein ITN1-like [Camelina sativa]|uniref:Ankyrin repeat-containing protein ITN1-like n=1 Tax=Camelina sativa TaxID=90675 RepID=A0ABM0UZ31_CAMSA|nr:PREDICTED: ankyrin repeat-containing protein ITN1-like [Camelina sativa]